MTVPYVSGLKKSKKEYYFTTHEDSMKFKFQSL